MNTAMKTEKERSRARELRVAELSTEARYARERFDLYKAYGPRATNPARLRKLERASALAEGRLRLAQTAPAEVPPDARADS